ncbi:MAG: hypothetical protein WCI51_00660 [Lentisphaerota bacterium]
MNKTKRNIEEVFKAYRLESAKCADPVFSAGWEARVMNEIGYAATRTALYRSDDVPLNAFAFRLGWAMLGLAFAISAVFYFAGINSLYKTDRGSKSSLWEFVDQSANVYDISLFDKTGKAGGNDIK